MGDMKRLLPIALVVLSSLAHASTVRTERVPEGGVQPQVATGADGVRHLVYLKGEAGGCDVRHATHRPGDQAWSTPATVNSEPRTAVAMGTIRGAQIAIGGDGTVHVVWNGPGSMRVPSPLFYARLEPGKTAFEAQRNLRDESEALDGGASVAAGAKGEVFIVWHGRAANAAPGEAGRVVFVRKSSDRGLTFAPLKIANLDYAGVCACCSLKSFITPGGELLTLYRAARRMDQRDVTLLASRDGGETFEHRTLGPWAINACPMSSMGLASTGAQTRAAWETEGKIFTSLLEGHSDAIAVSGSKARHPALAVNPSGETLVAWSVGTGWQRGGGVEWRVLDATGRPTGQHDSAQGVPVWGCSAVYAEDKGFVVMW